MAVFGTCAGMIFLAAGVTEGTQPQLGVLDIVVRRNAFGRQNDSFEADIPIRGLDEPFHAVFIRAPWVEKTGSGVECWPRWTSTGDGAPGHLRCLLPQTHRRRSSIGCSRSRHRLVEGAAWLTFQMGKHQTPRRQDAPAASCSPLLADDSRSKHRSNFILHCHRSRRLCRLMPTEHEPPQRGIGAIEGAVYDLVRGYGPGSVVRPGRPTTATAAPEAPRSPATGATSVSRGR